MVRRRSTVRFRNGAPVHGQFSNGSNERRGTGPGDALHLPVGFQYGWGFRAVSTAKTASILITGTTAGTASATGPAQNAGLGSHHWALTLTGSGSGGRYPARPGSRSRTSSKSCTPRWTQGADRGGLHGRDRGRGLAGRGTAGACGQDGRGLPGFARPSAGGHRPDPAAGSDCPGRAQRAGEDGGDPEVWIIRATFTLLAI